MIAHVVLFKPKPDLTPDQRQAVFDGLKAAAVGIPSVRRFYVGPRVKHGLPGYEQMMREDYQYALVVELDDLDGLKAYLTHPQHAAIGKHFSDAAAAALAYDFAMDDLKS
jgi:hypothetical protein